MFPVVYSAPDVRRTVLAVGCLLGMTMQSRALDIRFDFSRDTAGFFAVGTEARRVLESAEAYYESILQDTLGALTPIAPNAITVDFLDPTTQALVKIVPPPIPANVILIYVGATNLSGNVVGSSWHGGIYPFGLLPWLDYVDTRGQSGMVYGSGANEVAPWGGSITVDTLDGAGAPRPWDYSLGVKTAGTGLHFYSLLIHEMAHVFGFGICDSWWKGVNGNGQFTGSHAVVAHRGAVPLASGNNHWQSGTTSTIYGTAVEQETSMDPVLIQDAPSYATTLDMAALSDLGWQVGTPPSAPAVPVLATAMNPTSNTLVLSWKGSSRCKYTLLVTSDFTGWKARGASLPGSTGEMQISLPMDGSVIAYRLLVENSMTATVAKSAPPEAKPADIAGELTTRPRKGGGALMRLTTGEHGTSHHVCGKCESGADSPLEALLRADWASPGL